jgi:hypothetical protein
MAIQFDVPPPLPMILNLQDAVCSMTRDSDTLTMRGSDGALSEDSGARSQELFGSQDALGT